VYHVGIVNAGKGSIQLLLPIAEQEAARKITEENVRLINCWLGISTKESIGSTFCVDCEYLGRCNLLYTMLDRAEKLHPAARAREVLIRFRIETDYL